MTHHPHDRAGLLSLAARKLLETQRALAPDERQAATLLLADLYATGLRHGITPEHWAAVTSLGHETIDAVRLRDRVMPAERRPSRDGDALQQQQVRDRGQGREL